MTGGWPGSAAAGERLAGRWTILSELGRGGFSVVYEARDETLGQIVAVKLLVPPPAAAEVALERLRREVRAVRAISHPNIVPVYDLVEESTRAYLVMERVKGRDLSTAVAAEGRLPAADVAAAGRQIAEALATAHRAGILHRDVKPANILLGDDGRALLCDFGAARLDGDSTLTRTGAFVGTLDYAAPEAVAGARADGRADVYSLGLALYFALCGQLPARSAPHMPAVPPEGGFHPRSVRPDVPAALDAAVARATARQARDRFPTAGLFASALAGRPGPSPVTALAATPMPAAPFCLRCGGATRATDGVCAICANVDPATDDVLLFLDPAAATGAAATAALGTIPQLDPTARREVAAGRRALSLSSGQDARQLAARLNALGLAPVEVPMEQAARRTPASFYLLLAGMTGAGFWVAAVSPPLAWVGPPLAIVLLLLGRRALRRPAFERPASKPRLPPALRNAISSAMGGIGSEPIRALLADLVEIGSPWLAPPGERGHGDHDEAGRQAERILLTACDAARALARLDDTVARLTRRAAVGGAPPPALVEALASTTRARDALMQQLLEALASLASGTPGAGPRSPQALTADLGRLDQDLRAELEIRDQAEREVAALLA